LFYEIILKSERILSNSEKKAVIKINPGIALLILYSIVNNEKIN